MSYSPKFSLPIFTDAWKMYMAYALTVAYSPNFSLPIAFTCMVCQNFPCQIFPMYGMLAPLKYIQLEGPSLRICIHVRASYSIKHLTTMYQLMTAILIKFTRIELCIIAFYENSKLIPSVTSKIFSVIKA